MRAINKVGRCTRNTAHKSLPRQKNTKLYGRHRLPYNLVFIWCFNLQNGQLRKVTIHIFESHKSPQCSTFLDFRLPYGGDKLLLEKENIYTLDSKGELLITIMSSLAQEESRSISENVKWGQNKRRQDGKVNLPYKQFLGYEKGEDGQPKIVEKEAKTVRLIYKLFLEGKTFGAISRFLNNSDILTPSKRGKWAESTVQSILTNEKYKGDAILQKTFCVDFLTKKMKKNEGELPQFYVENSHPYIISPEIFDMVQNEVKRRKQFGSHNSSARIFSSKIICGDCGNFFGPKVWHSNTKYRRKIWQCNSKFKNKKKCQTPHLDEKTIKDEFVKAFNDLIKNKDEVISDCEETILGLMDTTLIDKEITKLQQECEAVAELTQSLVSQNSRKAMNQDEYNKKYDSYSQKYKKNKSEIHEAEEKKQDLKVRGEKIRLFIGELKNKNEIISEFNEQLWYAMIDKVVVNSDETLNFEFKNGKIIK